MFDVSADTTAWIMTALVAMALLGVVFAAHWFWR
jgi:predicted Co/Zn/Cd cation transporter (cation efflux family)